jgi:hypothetical protein
MTLINIFPYRLSLWAPTPEISRNALSVVGFFVASSVSVLSLKIIYAGIPFFSASTFLTSRKLSNISRSKEPVAPEIDTPREAFFISPIARDPRAFVFLVLTPNPHSSLFANPRFFVVGGGSIVSDVSANGSSCS